MEHLDLIIDLYRDLERQGVGGRAETAKVMALANLDPTKPYKILDIGCGTGAASLQLAESLNATLTAVDLLPEFLQVLDQRAAAQNLADRIQTRQCAMDQLPFAAESFDILWSEGAIYNVGFKAGISHWWPFLKPGGLLIVSDITWLCQPQPPEVQQYWQTAYAEIDTAAAKIQQLSENGYIPLAYYALPSNCWLEHFYLPLQAGFEAFLKRHAHSEPAKSLVAETQKEIEMYKNHSQVYTYSFFIAQKPNI